MRLKLCFRDLAMLHGAATARVLLLLCIVLGKRLCFSVSCALSTGLVALLWCRLVRVMCSIDTELYKLCESLAEVIVEEILVFSVLFYPFPEFGIFDQRIVRREEHELFSERGVEHIERDRTTPSSPI